MKRYQCMVCRRTANKNEVFPERKFDYPYNQIRNQIRPKIWFVSLSLVDYSYEVVCPHCQELYVDVENKNGEQNE